MVPGSIVSAPCFAYDPSQSGDCWNPSAPGLVESKRVNTAPLYPPVYYAVTGIFASTDVQLSVFLIRAFNAVLAVGLLTATFWALPRRLRPALVISAVGSAIPLGVFIYPSTNPSAWAFLSAATVWVSVLGATQSTGRRRWVLVGLALLGALLGAGARADAAVFAVFGAGLGLLIGLRRSSLLIPLGTVFVIALMSISFYLSAGQSSSLVSGLPSENAPLTRNQLVENALAVPSLWTGALGGWGLGWLDTGLPATVSVLTTLTVGAIIAVGLYKPRLRRALAVCAAVAALWAVPFVLLAQSRAVVGELVQPRYILPLIIILLGVASASENAERLWSRARRLSVGAALTVAFTVALYYNTRRYTTGTDASGLNPGTDMEWWWPAAPAPLVNLAIGALAFATSMALLAIAGRATGEKQAEDGRLNTVAADNTVAEEVPSADIGSAGRLSR